MFKKNINPVHFLLLLVGLSIGCRNQLIVHFIDVGYGDSILIEIRDVLFAGIGGSIGMILLNICGYNAATLKAEFKLQ